MGSKPIRFIVGALLLCVPGALAALAWPRFVEGVEILPFDRVKLAAIGGDPMPVENYRLAAKASAELLPDDGAERGWHAQFVALSAGVDSASVARTREAAEAALRVAPVDTHGWTVLCEAEASVSSERGTRCLDIAFPVTRYDWYTADKRMSLVAFEWPYLDQTLRDEAVSLVVPMWKSTQWTDNSTLRWVLFDLSHTPNGRQLLLAGLDNDRTQVREFNRWVLLEQINGY